MVTAEEQRAVQEENAKDDERFWDTMRDLNAASVEEHKSLIAAAEAKLKGHESAAADAGEKLETAKDRLQRLQRGESVSGGLGKKFDVVAAMKAAGITPGMLRRMRLYGSLTETEFESLLGPTRMKRRIEAADKVVRSRGATDYPGAAVVLGHCWLGRSAARASDVIIRIARGCSVCPDGTNKSDFTSLGD